MPTPSRHAPPAPGQPRRVLVIRPRFVGDVCMTLPVLSHLRRLAPQAELHYLTEEATAPLLVEDPRLARLWVSSRRATVLAHARLCAALRRARFDLVLDLFCNPRTAMWTAATGARWRVGYPGKRLRSAAYNLHARPTLPSAVRFHLASLEALGWPVEDEVPELYLTDGERKAAWNHLAERGVPAGAEIVGCHPGARFPTRRWDPADYAALGRLLAARRPRAWLLVFAGPGEEEQAQAIAHGVGGPRAVAITHVALRRFAALVQLCRAFVAGDSGPAHVAVAAGTPTVGLFGRNEPERFFPYAAARGHRAISARVWCSPCSRDHCDHLSCLRAIPPEWVADELEAALAFEPATPRPAREATGPVPTFLLGARPKPAAGTPS